MNRRILKKLCKRAAPILIELGDTREQFRVDGENEPSWSCPRMDRKHIDRWRGKPNPKGYFVALDGTVGVGGMSGYYEPEWDDEPAWDALQNYAFYLTYEYSRGSYFAHARLPNLRIPTKVFALLAAHRPTPSEQQL